MNVKLHLSFFGNWNIAEVTYNINTEKKKKSKLVNETKITEKKFSISWSTKITQTEINKAI